MHHASLDRYAGDDTIVHRLDARVKIAAALMCTGAAVSEARDQPVAQIPYLVAPVSLILMSGVPLRFILKRALIVSPFAIAFAAVTWAFEPRMVNVTIGPHLHLVPLGAILGATILMKYVVSVAALLALATTTPMAQLAGALRSFGVPSLLAMQVAMLYRYLFVVTDEFERRRRAAAARTVGALPVSMRVAASGWHLGSLFARSLDRAERVAAAMSARGFDPSVPLSARRSPRVVDILFLVGAAALTVLLRLHPVAA